MRALALVLLLGACTQYEAQIREGGDRVFSELETGSALAIDASARYLCRTARVGPLLDRLDTEDERLAWENLCESTPALP